MARAGALALPLRDASVDLIVTSPPYFGQRAYSDGREHYDGQIGSEATPQEYLTALWAVTAECWRVLKPTGSMFVNLGDKRSGSGGPGTTSGLGGTPQGNRTGMVTRGDRAPAGSGHQGAQYGKAAFGRAKSKQLLPHRYAIGCEDGLADPDGIGWIVRQDLVWEKPNGLPESVRDRTRDGHEYWFMLTKQPDYFAAVDEIRESYADAPGNRYPRKVIASDVRRRDNPISSTGTTTNAITKEYQDLTRGKLPSSVWRIPTAPLVVPDWLEIEHFAAFPAEWPRRLILGWSPNGICTTCGQGRAPVVERPGLLGGDNNPHSRNGERARSAIDEGAAEWAKRIEQPDRIVGYACACDDPIAPTRPAVVLDPFGGSGTTAMVARALGRAGISFDLSADYCRLARWRVFESGHGARVESRTNADRQGVLL